uniref:Sulfatase N-terminal domain-containing protein n=1 Tax=Pseudictyota dubia TaxID=2749911 RepID=A0A7R9VVC5_9STRA|mmetsp:Transcript_24533/g.45390  ORF Transcript_24533/g.45390 Transcript_24533/m.45390 type:complete len:167 (+) Transcript_24533:713-1213(+)
MDWIAGRILDSLKPMGVEVDILVIFAADNGPRIAEGSRTFAGMKGPFEGRWLKDNVDEKCTACPSMFVHDLTDGWLRRCWYIRPPPPAASSGGGVDGGGVTYVHLLGVQEEEDKEEETVDNIHCDKESGLGSAWEANIRVPALVSWPNGRVPRGAVSDDLVSTWTL